MKIGIITFHSAHNYGAVLQAWSLQEYLKQQGHLVEIVNLRLPIIDKLYWISPKPKKKWCSVKAMNWVMNKAYYLLKHCYVFSTNNFKYKKYRSFEKFINKKLPVTEPFFDAADLRKASLQYDVLIAGSDQIWNAKMMDGIDPAYFLSFSNKSAKRISYAASIGTNEIPEMYKILFKRYLSDFDYISVREHNALEQIQPLVSTEVNEVADPTFLLKREDFDRLKKDSGQKGEYIYVHNVHIKRVDEDLNGVAEKLSKQLNLPIIYNHPESHFSNIKAHFGGGIEEFLGMVANARYVVTNSFHCTVFALIYERDFITVPHFQHPERMKDLLGKLGVSDHLIGQASKLPKDLSDLVIDYGKVQQEKAKMREQSIAFLDKAVNGKKRVDKTNYFNNCDIFKCYGCGTCKDICPANAITMVPDKEGFSYPRIDEEKCIHCNKCSKNCIYHNIQNRNTADAEEFPKVYAAYAKDEQIVNESTSGGMFTVLYRKILKEGGAAVGVKYDVNMKVVYDIGTTQEECEAFRGAKYVDPESGNIKPRVKEILEKGTPVLFFGSPCQIAGLKSYLGKAYEKYEHLYTVELICHGVGSPKLFERYKEYLENLYQSKIVNYEFRNKFKGVDNPFVVVTFESGSIYLEAAKTDNFSRSYRSNMNQRPACFNCEYAGLKRGMADITIGDYWGIKKEHPEMQNEHGVSLIKINTQKGMELFRNIESELVCLESTYEKAYRANHTKPMRLMSARGKLMFYLNEKPVNELLQTFNYTKKGGLKL